MMATVPHVTSGSGLRKFQADGFLFDRVYMFKLSTTENLIRSLRFQDITMARAEKCTQNSTYPKNGNQNRVVCFIRAG